MAAALGQMMCNITIGKKKFAAAESRLKEIRDELERLGARLRELIAEDAESFEAVLYEGYGPGGVAMLVEAMTDNRNRTGSDMRHIFSKHGGNLGEPGSVAYLFDKRGLIVVDAERYSEDDLLVAIEAGALDVDRDDDMFEVLTEPADLAPVRRALEEAGVEPQAAELGYHPKTTVPVEEEGARRLLRLVDALEDNDDVDEVHANVDVDAAVMRAHTAGSAGRGSEVAG